MRSGSDCAGGNRVSMCRTGRHKKPSGVRADYRVQVATYAMPASGRTRLQTLTKTKTVQLHSQTIDVTHADRTHATKLYQIAQEGMRSGLYVPNRSSFLCSRKYCSFWGRCGRSMGRGGVGPEHLLEPVECSSEFGHELLNDLHRIDPAHPQPDGSGGSVYTEQKPGGPPCSEQCDEFYSPPSCSALLRRPRSSSTSLVRFITADTFIPGSPLDLGSTGQMLPLRCELPSFRPAYPPTLPGADVSN
jgi:hypothetical protein